MTAAVEQIDQAQQLLDAHILVLPAGACRLCGTVGTCDVRDAAQAVFARYRRLPRRRPGASHKRDSALRRSKVR